MTPWEQAEKLREALEATASGGRTKADYERVMDAYRAVYHDAPQDMHAAAAVDAVAELLTEEGRGDSAEAGLGRARSSQAVKRLKAALGQ